MFFIDDLPQVAKIDIQYARTAKKMDVKKLKAVMWEHLITEPEQDKVLKAIY